MKHPHSHGNNPFQGMVLEVLQHSGQPRFRNPVVVGELDSEEKTMIKAMDDSQREIVRLQEQIEIREAEMHAAGMKLAHKIEDRLHVPGHLPYSKNIRTGQVIMDQETAESYQLDFTPLASEAPEHAPVH